MINSIQEESINVGLDEIHEILKGMNKGFLNFEYECDPELSLMTTHLIGLVYRYRKKLLGMKPNFENGWPVSDLPKFDPLLDGEKANPRQFFSKGGV